VFAVNYFMEVTMYSGRRFGNDFHIGSYVSEIACSVNRCLDRTSKEKPAEMLASRATAI
jgi:hypothetical protein